jgi:hypothetical protein
MLTKFLSYITPKNILILLGVILVLFLWFKFKPDMGWFDWAKDEIKVRLEEIQHDLEKENEYLNVQRDVLYKDLAQIKAEKELYRYKCEVLGVRLNEVNQQLSSISITVPSDCGDLASEFRKQGYRATCK